MAKTGINENSPPGAGFARLWVDQPLANGAIIDLPTNSARHVAALRLREGDEVRLFDGGGGEWRAELRRITRDGASARLLGWQDLERESPLDTTLALGISSGDRMDFAIQKATELGVTRIQPLATTRSVVRLKGEREERRMTHWRAVAIAACEQCGRNRIPDIGPVMPVLDFVVSTSSGVKILLSPDADKGLGEIPVARQVTLLVGAEGGLTEEERNDALHAGFVPVRLGPRVLRTETAPLAALAAVQLAWGDFSAVRQSVE